MEWSKENRLKEEATPQMFEDLKDKGSSLRSSGGISKINVGRVHMYQNELYNKSDRILAVF